MTLKINPLLRSDFYKVGHPEMYHEKMTFLYSSLICRSDKYATDLKFNPWYEPKVIIFGTQYIVKNFLIENFNENFFNRELSDVLREYDRRVNSSIGGVDISHVEKLHKLGYLPIELKAIEEGSFVNLQIPVVTVKSTHPDFAWLVNSLETTLLNELWKMITIATVSFNYRQILDHFAAETSDDLSFVDFQGHDFSMRGQDGLNDAMTSGAAFLTSFKGTDSIPSLDFLEYYYGGRIEDPLGHSVYASEHSVMCSSILYNHQVKGLSMSDSEEETFKDLLTKFPKGILSLVSDSFDFWNVITKILPNLKDLIESRDGKLVIRPDSDDAVTLLCGMDDFSDDIFESIYSDHTFILDGNVCKFDKDHYEDLISDYGLDSIDTEVLVDHCIKVIRLAEDYDRKGAIEMLYDIFGGFINSKGFKVLNPKIGVIQGDSINIKRMNEICNRLKKKGFASTNLVFGIGAYSLNGMITRDTFGQAFKATACIIDGKLVEVRKDPKTDHTKKSPCGLLHVNKDEKGNYILLDKVDFNLESQGELKTVFKDGELLIETDIYKIRERIKNAGIK